MNCKAHCRMIEMDLLSRDCVRDFLESRKIEGPRKGLGGDLRVLVSHVPSTLSRRSIKYKVRIPSHSPTNSYFGSSAACSIPVVKVKITIMQAVTPNPPCMSSLATDQDTPNATLAMKPASPITHSFIQFRPSTK